MSVRLAKIKSGILSHTQRSTLLVLLLVLCAFFVIYAAIYHETSLQLKDMALMDSQQSFSVIASDIDTTLQKEWEQLTDMDFIRQIRQYLPESGSFENDTQIFSRLLIVSKTLKSRFGTGALISNVLVFYFTPEKDCLCSSDFCTDNLKRDYENGIMQFDDMTYTDFRSMITSSSSFRFMRSPMKTGRFYSQYSKGTSAQNGFLICSIHETNARSALYVALQINIDYLRAVVTASHYADPGQFAFSQNAPDGKVSIMNDNIVYIDEGNQIRLSHYISQLGGYCTICLDNSTVYAGIENFSVLFRLLLYSVIFLLAVLTLTFFWRWHYPVLRIARKLPGNETLPPLKVIDNHISELQRQNNTYQEKVDQLEPARKSAIIRTFLRNDANTPKSSSEFTDITGITNSTVFRCICIGPLNNTVTMADSDILLSTVHPVVSAKLPCFAAVVCDEHCYTALIPVESNTAEQFRLDLEDILASLNALDDDCPYAIGMSESYIGRDSAPIAYREALFAWTDAHIWKNSEIVNCDTVEGLSNDYNVDYKQLDTLYNFLLRGDSRSALATFDTLVSQNFNPESSLKLKQIYFQQFSFDMIGVLARLSSQYDLSMEIDTLLSARCDLTVDETLEQLRGALAHCCDMIPKMDMHDALSSAVCQYCEEHYQDPDLSLSTISEVFGFGESNMSKFFKSHTGMSYSAYMENLRIAKAEPLLTSTQMNVKDVATSVGYQNVATFYKAFRRKYGCTPSQWMENHRAFDQNAAEADTPDADY